MIEQFIFKRLAWHRYRQNLTIGGLVAVGIDTPYKLADAFNLNVSYFSAFKIIDDVIHCRLSRYPSGEEQGVPKAIFRDNVTSFTEDEGVIGDLRNGFLVNATKLHTLDLKVKESGIGGFPKITYTQLESLTFSELVTIGGNQNIMYNSKLKYIYLPKAETITGNSLSFGVNQNLELFDAKKLKHIHQYSGVGNSHFQGTGKIGNCVYKVHQSLATSAPDGGLNLHLRSVHNDRGATIEFYNDNGEYVGSY